MRTTYGVESVINQMLQILAHSDLPHKFVLVSIHSGKLANVSKDILEAICQLESINVV